MRIRQVRPEFWTDERLASMPDPARLFYIGLWGIADDAGWMRWEPLRIGALLYPYRPTRRRDRDIASWADLLVEAGRLVLHECGCANIPTLSRHQVVGGRRSESEYRRHLDKHDVRIVPDIPEVLSVSSNGRERNVTGGYGGADATEERSAQLAAFRRIGLPVDVS